MTVWCYLFVLCKKMSWTLFYCRSDFEEIYICLLRSRGNFGMDHCSNNIMSKFRWTFTKAACLFCYWFYFGMSSRCFAKDKLRVVASTIWVFIFQDYKWSDSSHGSWGTTETWAAEGIWHSCVLITCLQKFRGGHVSVYISRVWWVWKIRIEYTIWEDRM